MPTLTPGELAVMRLLWQHGEMKPAEIQRLFPEPIKNPALRSYLTILLVKRHVVRRKVGKVYFYKAVTRQTSAFRSALRDVVDTWCDGSVKALVLGVIRAEKLSADDLVELQRIAAEDPPSPAQKDEIMNALISDWLALASSNGWPVGLLRRITLLLAVIWLLHAGLARANPRWRVLVWRGAAVAMLLVALALFGPAIQLPVLPPIAKTAALQADDSGSSLDPSAAIPASAAAGAAMASAMPGGLAAEDELLGDSGPFDAPWLAYLSGPITPAAETWSAATLLWSVWTSGWWLAWRTR